MHGTLKITTLGGLTIQRDGEPVTGFVSRKVEALLVYIAINPREHPREVLGEMLWDDLPQDRTMSYLRTALSSLQKQLADYLLVTRQTIAVDPDADIWLDVAVLNEALDAAAAQWQERRTFTRAVSTQLEDALELYQGGFLEGFNVRDCRGFEGWMLLEQERTRNRVLEALYRLGQYAAERGHYSDGVQHITRALQLDPLWEEAHRLLMRLLVYTGQRSAALAQYETCRQILEDELGVEPEDDTVALYEQIQAGEISAAETEDIPNNLPVLATAFVDRPADLAEISANLIRPDCRLLTLVGSGGIGKTRLALEAARQHLSDFPHGVYAISLTDLTNPDHLVRAIAQALNLTFEGRETPEAQVINHLHDLDMLLVLDNFDHLLPAADTLSRLLAGAPSLKLLVTGRERLNLREEWLYTVEAMPVPEDPADENAANYPAMQLFEQSAQRVRSDFSVGDSLETVIGICQLVGGVPLAIELAASWVRVMPCTQILEAVQRGLDVLSTSLRNVPERHRSIRAVYDTSWTMLDENEQAVFERLAAFGGRFTAEAAQAVADASIFTLSALVDKSLLRPVDGHYTLHSLLRQFAGEKLDANPDEKARVLQKHSVYYAGFLRENEDYLFSDLDDKRVDAVLMEFRNVLAGWRHALDQNNTNLIDAYMRPLHRLLEMRGWMREGERTFKEASERLGASTGADLTLVQARALLYRGIFAHHLSDYDAAEKLLDAALVVFDRENAYNETYEALNCLVNNAYERGNYPQARKRCEAILQLPTVAVPPEAVANVYFRLTDIAVLLGNYAEAQRILEEELPRIPAFDDREVQMRFFSTLGSLKARQGDYQEAQTHLETVLELSEALNNRFAYGMALFYLGRVATGLGNLQEAQRLCEQSIDLFNSINNPWGKSYALMYLGRVHMALANYAEARHHLLTGAGIARSIGSRWVLAYTLRQLALVNHHLGGQDEARQNLNEALVLAMEHRAVPLLLDIFVGIADADLRDGEYRSAAELVKYVLSQPVVEHETLQNAERLRDKLAAEAGDTLSSGTGTTYARLTTVVQALRGEG